MHALNRRQIQSWRSKDLDGLPRSKWKRHRCDRQVSKRLDCQPTVWDWILHNLFYEWEQTTSPAGAIQGGLRTVMPISCQMRMTRKASSRHVHDRSALKEDRAYRAIAKQFHNLKGFLKHLTRLGINTTAIWGQQSACLGRRLPSSVGRIQGRAVALQRVG